jgi:transposase
VPGVATPALTAKKKSLHDSQRDTPRVQAARADFQQTIAATLGETLRHWKFFDEMGLNLGLTSLYGRAVPGQRVVEATPGHSGAHYTAVALLSCRRLQAPSIWEGSMTAARFEAYVAQDVAPCLRRDDVMVVDNLSAHKSAAARQCIEARGARLLFLPPYSPDFNPIELCWGKVKTALRTAKARTWEALIDALADALRSVQRRDIHAWFAHCGYPLP